jgi:hypothetical protein
MIAGVRLQGLPDARKKKREQRGRQTRRIQSFVSIFRLKHSVTGPEL